MHGVECVYLSILEYPAYVAGLLLAQTVMWFMLVTGHKRMLPIHTCMHVTTVLTALWMW